VPKDDSSKFLSKTANSSSQSILFSLSHLVKQVTADENSLVFSSLPNKVLGSLLFQTSEQTGYFLLQTSAIPHGE